MTEPKFTISGLRGVWGTELTAEAVDRYARAFAAFLKSQGGTRVLIGRDGRGSGGAIAEVLAAALSASGLDVVDGGILPTPTVLFVVRTEGFSGGIIATASHNPIEYNGLKFVTSEGLFIDAKAVAAMKAAIGGNEVVATAKPGSISSDETLGAKHIEHILAQVDIERIRAKRFKVVIDPINASGCVLGPMLLERLGCDVHALNCEPDGNFAHPPEPIPEHLKMLGEAVLKQGAALGFAQDPDADRLVLADETGTVVFEEYTLALAVKAALLRQPGPVVANLSTSRTAEDIAESYSVPFFRTPVGEANVVAGIKKHGAIIGGEGSGGVIYPAMNPCRDSFAGMALILELLAREEKPLSDIVAGLPRYAMKKTKFPFTGTFDDLKAKVIGLFPDATVNEEDGIRFDFPDRSWVTLRASNTEPIARAFAEAKTMEQAEALLGTIAEALR